MSSETGLRSLLREGLEQLSLDLPSSAQDRLLHYHSLLEDWRASFSLVNHHGEALLIRHILDSLAPLSFLKKWNLRTAADIGSGAGFPGIPLRIACPEIAVTLVEPSRKRMGFLRNAVLELSLDGVDFLEYPFQNIRQTFDLLLFRGLSPLSPKLIQALQKRTSPRGFIAAYKGQKSRILREIGSEQSARLLPLRVPFLPEERHLVLFPPNGGFAPESAEKLREETAPLSPENRTKQEKSRPPC